MLLILICQGANGEKGASSKANLSYVPAYEKLDGRAIGMTKQQMLVEFYCESSSEELTRVFLES